MTTAVAVLLQCVMMRRLLLDTIACALAASVVTAATGQERSTQLDATVQAFLKSHRGTWHDLNVPESDGRALHDLIVKHKFRRALEIGTSTGTRVSGLRGRSPRRAAG
jgi:hypothetical protein